MADERILAGIRRFWTEEQVKTAYQAVLTAYASGVEKESVIIGTTFDGQSTNAAVVMDREAMKEWMDACEQRLAEIEAEDDGQPPDAGAAAVFNFSNRYVGT